MYLLSWAVCLLLIYSTKSDASELDFSIIYEIPAFSINNNSTAEKISASEILTLNSTHLPKPISKIMIPFQFSKIYGDELPSLIYQCKDPDHVALTFDDGISKFTNSIYDILEEESIPATFFIITKSLESSEEAKTMLKKLSEKHEIGSHTHTHPNLTNLTEFLWKEEILKSIEIIENISGKKVLYFRPPYSYDYFLM